MDNNYNKANINNNIEITKESMKIYAKDLKTY
jgi:hypothetical protein